MGMLCKFGVNASLAVPAVCLTRCVLLVLSRRYAGGARKTGLGERIEEEEEKMVTATNEKQRS